MNDALWLPGVLRRSGVPFRTLKGWRDRGRPYTFDPIGVMLHHDASNRHSGPHPALRIIRDGRPGIPGPLSQVQLSRGGVWILVAAGYANHAGEGGPFRMVPKDSGNRYFLGIEVANDGIGEPYSRELKESLDTGVAAILDYLDQGPGWCTSHKEWAPGRKIDPCCPFNMDVFRQRVRDELHRPGRVRL